MLNWLSSVRIARCRNRGVRAQAGMSKQACPSPCMWKAWAMTPGPRPGFFPSLTRGTRILVEARARAGNVHDEPSVPVPESKELLNKRWACWEEAGGGSDGAPTGQI